MTDIAFALMALAAVLPYSIGYITGIIVRAAKGAGDWGRAAFLTGYRKGRGE